MNLINYETRRPPERGGTLAGFEMMQAPTGARSASLAANWSVTVLGSRPRRRGVGEGLDHLLHRRLSVEGSEFNRKLPANGWIPHRRGAPLTARREMSLV